MLRADLGERAMKWPISAKPFINDHRQGVLIAGRAGPSLNLFGRHVANRPGDIGVLVTGTLGYERDAKIAQQDVVASSQ